MYTEKDVKTEIVKYVFENGRVHYSVRSKLGVHTMVNQAETEQEADRIKAAHVVSLLNTYNPVEKPVDTSTAKKEKTTRGRKKAEVVEEESELAADLQDYDDFAEETSQELNAENMYEAEEA